MYLRRQLTGFLRQFTSLMADEIAMSSSETRIHHVSHLKQQVVSWYRTRVYPIISVTPMVPAHHLDCSFPEACERKYPQIIFAFLDCVICSLICALDEIIVAKDPLDALHSPHPGNNAAREVAAMAYLNVCETSYITAQHLSFGLGKLRCHNRIP